MKIAQIVCTFPPYAGGIGNSALTIGELLNSKHQVTTFFPQQKEKATGAKQTIIPLKPLLRYGHGAFLPQILRQLRSYDAIYLHYPFFGTAELVWLFQNLTRGNKKLVIHYHMDVAGLSKGARILSLPSKLIFKSLFKKADRIITASLDYVENSQLKNIYQKYPEKFREIPFGVDTSEFRPTGDRAESNRILFVGGLDSAHYFKGVDKLIEAAQNLKSRDWKMTIVGEGDLKPYYREQVRSLGLENRINFPGKASKKELVEYYQTSDVLVLPSIDGSEAFGIVLVEAMACGLPVIASDLPGVRRVFRHGREGYLATPGKSEDLAAKIDLVLKDPGERREMGRRARKKAEEEYSLEAMQKKLNQVMEG